MGAATEALAQPVMQTQELPIEAASKSYEYAHADGTVHHAESAESARAACPVLGKMAVEQADLLLEVAALGQQKMKEEQAKDQPKQYEPEKIQPEQKPEPKSETTRPTKPERELNHESTPKPIGTKPQPEPIQEFVQQLMQVEKEAAIQTQVKSTYASPRETIIEPQPVNLSTEKKQHVERSPSEVYEQYAANQDEQNELSPPVATESRKRLPNAHPCELAVEQPASAGTNTAPARVTKKVEKAIDIIKTNATTTASINEMTTTEDAAPLEITVEADVANELELPDVVTTEADEQLDLRFEPEVIDTYEELFALTEGQAITLEQPEISDDTIESDIVYSQLSSGVVKLGAIEPVRDFETAVARQIETESFVPLETIFEQADDEQPLEQTLVRLTQYLTVVQQEGRTVGEADVAEWHDEVVSEQSELFIELRAILRGITEVLPHSYYINKKTDEQRIRITPELTEQLLLLLRSLGYEQPKEVLIGFMQLYGLAYLLQALQYMCQLDGADERREILITSAPTTTSGSSTNLGSLVGNAVLGLIVIKDLANETVAQKLGAAA